MSRKKKERLPIAPAGIGVMGSEAEHEKRTVESYRIAMESAHRAATKPLRAPSGLDPEAYRYKEPQLWGSGKEERDVRLNRLAWAFLREARLFNFDVRMYCEIYRQVDIFCTETVAGLPYHPPRWDLEGRIATPDVPPEEGEQLFAALISASPGAPYPEHFPFESVFIGYGHGITLSEWQEGGKFMGRLPELPLHSCTLQGALMTFSGYVWEIFYFSFVTGETATVLLPARDPDGGWFPTIDLSPWYLPVILDTINDHKTFVVEGYPDGMRKALRHARKKMGLKPGKKGKFWMPPPYYRVQLRDELVRERLEKSKPQVARQLHYRHDVRGHERCYIRRGPLPLDVETRDTLIDRGYKVYETTKPDAETNARLLKRGHVTKKPDEWVAIKPVWIDEHQRGPEDAPYIPALRTTGGKPNSFPPQGEE